MKDQTMQKDIGVGTDASKTNGGGSKHTLQMDGHERLAVTGVKAVPVFTDKGFTARLNGEALTVTGHGLEVKTLDVENGRLNVTGHVTSMKYTSDATPGSFLKKVFK